MARTLTLKGAVTGSVSIDGSGNVSLETTYATGNISALDNRYVNVGGDTMTGALTVDLGSGTKLVLGKGIQICATSGGWARGLVAYDASGDSALANGSICGAYGSGNTLQYTYYGGTYDSPAMVIRGGNVGIGTTSPSHKLHVAGGIYSSDYLQVGSARLMWDSSTGALYVQKSDGTACGFYATGFVSAKGANGDAGSVAAGVTELSELEDVTISSPVNGQALVYRNGVWKNETVETGLTTVSWEDVEGKPTWIGSTKPTYTAAEVGALTQTTADGRYAYKGGSNASGTWGIGITGNAGSATKLQTARTLWGQSFNGSANVSGNMTGVGSITMSGSISGVADITMTGDLTGFGTLLSGYGAGNRRTKVTANGFIFLAATTGWGVAFNVYSNDGGDSLGDIAGAYGAGNTLQYTYYGGTYDNPAMAILPSNKYVGIGTTSPSHKLHVAGGIYSSDYLQVGSARLMWDSSTGALYVQKSDGTACGFYATGFVSAKGANDDGASGDLTDIDSLTFTPGKDNRNLYLNANGMRIITTSSSGWGAGITVYDNANTTKLGDVCGAYGSGNTLQYTYYGGTYDSPAMVIRGGNVGIGTTSPTYKLHVSGTAYATGGFQNGSDIRYKHVLQDLALTVAQVAAAPSFLFRWTDGTADGVQAGTSAQYWQQVMPQVVTESAGRLSMQYDKAALAAAIATARAVETLDQRVTRLEKENARLRRRLRQHKINV